jgi:hypothetical protein
VAYVLKGKKSGTVRFEPKNGVIGSESLTVTNRVTSSPIDSGATISDHVLTDPDKLSVNGTVVADGARMKNRLITMTKNRELVEYQGKTRMKNMVIASCTFTESVENVNGFDFQMQLQEVSFAVSRTVRIAAGSSGKVVTAKKSAVKNTGLKTTSTKTVSTTSYLSSVNKAIAKSKNTSIAAARATVSDSGYGT